MASEAKWVSFPEASLRRGAKLGGKWAGWLLLSKWVCTDGCFCSLVGANSSPAPALPGPTRAPVPMDRRRLMRDGQDVKHGIGASARRLRAGEASKLMGVQNQFRTRDG